MNIRSIRAPNPGPFTLEGTQTWLLGETAVIDPGPVIDSHLDAIRAAMPRLRTILITHRHGDHAPGAIPLQAMTGAQIIAPPGVLEEQFPSEKHFPGSEEPNSDRIRRVAGGEVLDIDGEPMDVIDTPGHTREHVCYLTANGDLFTGDTILGAGTTAIFPPDGNMADYLRSLEVLRARAPKRIYPAHGPVREDAGKLIDEYIAHRLQREAEILEALQRGIVTLDHLRAQIYPDLDRRLHRAAEIQLTAHLIKLVDERRAPIEWRALCADTKTSSK